MRPPSSALPWSRRLTLIWAGLSAGGLLLVVLPLLPPWLPTTARWVLMQAFAPLCHQLPARSPVIDGVQIAVCDRCMGIYAGFAAGIVMSAGLRLLPPIMNRMMSAKNTSWTAVQNKLRYVLAGVLVPLAVDWAGPFVADWTVLDGWSNTPASRSLTGALLGVVAGVMLVVSIASSAARRMTSCPPGEQGPRSKQPSSPTMPSETASSKKANQKTNS